MIPPPGVKTFTSAASLRQAHAMRRGADAILTGSGCVLCDDPLFTVRHVPDHEDRRRILGLFDRRRRVPDAYISAAEGRGFEVRRFGDIGQALDDLGRRGCLTALVEAGPLLREAFLAADAWHEEVIFQAAVEAGAEDEVRILTRPLDVSSLGRAQPLAQDPTCL